MPTYSINADFILCSVPVPVKIKRVFAKKKRMRVLDFRGGALIQGRKMAGQSLAVGDHIRQFGTCPLGLGESDRYPRIVAAPSTQAL
jgi:hypothetical protein